MSHLHDKVAIVTGGAAGIGAACVKRFHADGAQVVIGDVDDQRGQALAKELGDRAMFIHLDVADENSFAGAIDKTVAAWGRLDILVNNAGIVLPSLPVQTTSTAEFDRLVNVNFRGTWHGCKFAYPHLLKTRGCVVNISSMSGVSGQENHAVYGATKGAINALTKCTAVDWGKSGVRINAICPGGVWTEALDRWAKEQPNPAEITSYLNRIHSLNYCAQPEQIASVAAFLASDDASFITGALVPVSGGMECGYKL